MINSLKRKRELSRITANLNLIENENDKNLMAAVTFPRIYSHYEKFMWEAFSYLIEKIYEEDIKLVELDLRIKHLFFSLNILNKNKRNIALFCGKLDLDDTVSVIDKKEVLKKLKGSSMYHQKLIDLLKIFSLDSHEVSDSLIRALNLLEAKYNSRNSIAHGEEDIEYLRYDEWKIVRDKIIEIFDLVTRIFDDYIDNTKYKIV